ncbi:MAG: DEAD/DEAH box helicase family protein [Desulfobacterales bacterium]|nr:DEAD/DEAH box helicase family protein [Desulfobacterales bacterium]MDJ0875593.1 DEAD/DEAH box helicase family protein [Desulfobacterales bacterium]
MATVQIKLSNRLYVRSAPEDLLASLIDTLTLPNPKWLENERMGRWNRRTPKELRYYRKMRGGGLRIPRGFVGQLMRRLRREGIAYDLIDKRRELPAVDWQFKGRLRPFQEKAVRDLARKEFGTLSAPTGSGKTVMGLQLIAARRQPTLIVVHTKDLAHQWVARVEQFLGIPPDEIGWIGGGKRRPGERITVALVQSLYKCASEIAPAIGHLVVDECHRTPSRTFTDAVTAFDARYMLGLSATPWRRDKLSKLIFWHIGDVQHEIEPEGLVASGDVLKAEVIRRETEFRPYFDPVSEYSRMLSELAADKARNIQIVDDVAAASQEAAGVCLVLSDRKAHCENLRALLKLRHGITAGVLTGDLPTTKRRALAETMQTGEVRVVVATGQLIGEGFDCPRLETLFLVTPIRFSGRLLQYLGRVLRPAPGKERARVFDYVDVHVDTLVKAARARQRVYER